MARRLAVIAMLSLLMLQPRCSGRDIRHCRARGDIFQNCAVTRRGRVCRPDSDALPTYWLPLSP
jgi:hypothetical protein